MIRKRNIIKALAVYDMIATDRTALTLAEIEDIRHEAERKKDSDTTLGLLWNAEIMAFNFGVTVGYMLAKKGRTK